MQKWEIAGISLAPIVESLLALNIHGAVGLSESQFLHIVLIIATLAAVVRAVIDKRKAAAEAGE